MKLVVRAVRKPLRDSLQKAAGAGDEVVAITDEKQ